MTSWSAPAATADDDCRFDVAIAFQERASLEGVWAVPPFQPALIPSDVLAAIITVTMAGDAFLLVGSDRPALEAVAQRVHWMLRISATLAMTGEGAA